MRNHKLCFVENAFIVYFTFDQQYNSFDKYNIPQHEQKRRKLEKKKENNNEMERVEVENPTSDVWLLKNRKSPWAGKKDGLQGELTEEQNKYDKNQVMSVAVKCLSSDICPPPPIWTVLLFMSGDGEGGC
ncbi:hypothetical protein Tco_1417669 [Tanacetum coccineum]